MLSLQKIQLQFAETPILRSVDLELRAGEVVAVLGPNGAGKSSLLKIASGELEPHSGEVLFDDRPLVHWPPLDKALRMAVLPQQSLLTFPYTVEEVVLLGRTPHHTGLQLDRQIVRQALQAADVDYLRQQIYTRLSGGEKQRVQLARVLAQVWRAEDSQRRLLVLDEPTSALDYAHQQLVARVVRERAAGGCAVLTAMHDLNLAAQCADRLVLMCCGEVRADGPPDDVLQEALLESVFEVPFHRLTHPQTGRPWLVN